MAGTEGKFFYSFILELVIEGGTYEFNFEWKTDVQLQVGSHLWIEHLGDLTVEDVTWFLFDDDNHALVDLGEVECDGTASEWLDLEKVLGVSSPPLGKVFPVQSDAVR